MILEFLLALLTTATVGALLWPLLRPRAPEPVARLDNDLAIYHDQLAELQKERAAGTLSDAEASAATTEIARRMVREWGMSDAVGPMAWSGHQQVFLGEDLMTQGREYSDDTAKVIDTEIARILHEIGRAHV